MTCSKCGTEVEDGARFCGGCGSQLDGAVIPRAAQRPYGKTVFQGGGSVPPPAKAARPEALAQTLAAPSSQRQAPRQSAPAPVVAPEPAPQPAQQPLPADLVGFTLNSRYQVGERLGEGGFGTVYKGEQIQMGRPCALKVLHPKMAKDQQVVGRFRREAQAASLLRNPHTVQIYDFDQTPEGILYLAMELLQGRSLHEVMQEGPMAPLRVARILDGIADSLGEAHVQGIVHRDIKPENVFLEPRGAETDFVKVLDFGIAKIVSGGDGQRLPALTAAGQTLGTLEYMSPEQLMGMDLDGRSDLYAIGILAYEMLTGNLPFICKTQGEMITHHLKTVPPPPSRNAPQSGIPQLLDAIVLKLLEKARDKRYRDTAALQEELRRLVGGLTGSGEVALPPSSGMPQVAPVPSRPRDAPMASAAAPVPASGMPRGLIIGVVALVLVLGVLAALLVAGCGVAHAGGPPPTAGGGVADVGPPAAARLVPSTMQAVVGADVAELRGRSPRDAVAVLEEAVKPWLARVGGDPTKVGQLAMGAGVGKKGKDNGAAVLIVDAALDPKRVEEALRKELKKGEKIGSGSYRGVKYKTLPGGGELVFLPGDRMVLAINTPLGSVLDLGRGEGAGLVDGAAGALLAKVGAAGGRGATAFWWTAVTDEMRADPEFARGAGADQRA